MKILSPKIHGYLDYLVVVWFLAAPTLFGLTGIAANISYALAIIHLGLTILTAFPLGVVKVIPLKFHGIIEFIVSFALIALPWVLGFASVAAARNFYVASGIAIFIVWLITRYQNAGVKTATTNLS
jgi:hypothetical protein